MSVNKDQSPRPRPVVLIVRDGWGCNPHPEHDGFNAVKLAKTPVDDRLRATYPTTLIHTSGEDVGLPEGTMGNSEVGHQNLGAGRVVDQESVRITKAIREGAFFTNEKLVGAVRGAQSRGRTVHLMGIASDAGVHGLMDHLYACLELCSREGQEKVALHLFTDGRDSGPFCGRDYVRQIEETCAEIGVGKVATICGRYYAMDRDNRWERVEKAYNVLTGRAKDAPLFTSAALAIDEYYNHPTTGSQHGDEFITPRLVGPEPHRTRIIDGDAVIFYNYRGDRPRELVKAFVLEDGTWAMMPSSPDTGRRGFDRGPKLELTFVTMSAYEQGLPVDVAFIKPPKMTNIGGEYLSLLGMKQFRCAETEKFPHVTFFFNDYREQPFEGESRKMAQSPKVATYDLMPEMSAVEVTGYVLEAIAGGEMDFILVNFANGDMVGHTGKLDAAIQAVQMVDGCVGRIVDATFARGGALIVTADHGNAEQMWDPATNHPHTAHTLYDVYLTVVDDRHLGAKLREGGRLADVFPTILRLMGVKQPEEMTGESLL